MKRKKKNADAGILYTQTGISQEALARYIGAKRSTLTHHLAGTRLLSGAAGLQLVNLIVKLVKLPPQPLVQTLSGDEKEELQRQVAWCRTQCIPVQKKLEAMQAEATKAARLLQFVKALQQEDTDITDDRQRWYDSQYYTAETRLEKNSRLEQLKLEVKIAALQNEAELYEAVLKA